MALLKLSVDDDDFKLCRSMSEGTFLIIDDDLSRPAAEAEIKSAFEGIITKLWVTCDALEVVWKSELRSLDVV